MTTGCIIDKLIMNFHNAITQFFSQARTRARLRNWNFLQMSRCRSFRCSRFRQVLGKPSSRERSYDGVPITRSVHDNHFCSVNPCFVAVVTECAGGGSFLVLPIHHVGGEQQLQTRSFQRAAEVCLELVGLFVLPDRQGGPSAPQGVWPPGTRPGHQVGPV